VAAAAQVGTVNTAGKSTDDPWNVPVAAETNLPGHPSPGPCNLRDKISKAPSRANGLNNRDVRFAVNGKAAKALGLTIPQSVLLRADR
jgi:hypothetical protein